VGLVAVIGPGARVQGWRLAGAVVLEAATPDEARRAWAGLAERADVTVVLLDPAVQAVLTEEQAARSTAGGAPLVAVLPA
jgi:vacuolar-type H+-ATPase subunit F/Vma7